MRSKYKYYLELTNNKIMFHYLSKLDFIYIYIYIYIYITILLTQLN